MKGKGLLLWALRLKHSTVFKMLLPGSAHIFHLKTMNIVISNLW